MTVKITKKEALEMTAQLWDYLSRNPDTTKGQAIHALGLPPLKNECPCCEYAKQHSTYEWLDCTLCPLAKTFGVAEAGDYACENYYDSPYNGWDHETVPEKKAVFAAEIFLAAAAAWAEEEEGKWKI